MITTIGRLKQWYRARTAQSRFRYEERFEPYIADKNLEGVDFQIYVGNQHTQLWYDNKNKRPTWELSQIRAKLPLRDAQIIEIGAHHGITTVLLSHWIGPSGNIMALEPNPENFSILKKNIEINNLDNCVLLPLAINNENDALYLSRQTNSSVEQLADETDNLWQCNAITLDQLCTKYSFAPSLIKVDIEGYEIHALEGAQEALAKHRPNLCIEVHTDVLPHYGRKPADILKNIDVSSYEIWILPSSDLTRAHAFNGSFPKERFHFIARTKTT